MTDQLSADLASLRIHRDEDPDRPGPLRWVVLAIVLIIAGAACVFGYPYIEARVFKTEVSVTEVGLLSPAQAQVQLSSTGYVTPQVLSRVGAKVAGRVGKVLVRERDTVKRGDPLVVLDDVDQRSAVAAARQRLAAAQARAEAARANLIEVELQARRARGLAQRGVGTEASAVDLEARQRSLQASLRAAEADIRAAEAEAATAALSQQHMIIAAPIDGTVVTRPVQVGEMVSPDTAPVLELADFQTLEVETDVPEARLSQVKEGGPAEIVLDAYPGRRYRGRTQKIGARVNRQKATVVVKVAFVDSRDGVLPDMAARVSFLSAELTVEETRQAPRQVLPGAAVTERAGSKVVFTLSEGRARLVPVVLGPAIGTGFELKAGPPPGTRLVRDPPPTLSDGQSVKEKGE